MWIKKAITSVLIFIVMGMISTLPVAAQNKKSKKFGDWKVSQSSYSCVLSYDGWGYFILGSRDSFLIEGVSGVFGNSRNWRESQLSTRNQIEVSNGNSNQKFIFEYSRGSYLRYLRLDGNPSSIMRHLALGDKIELVYRGDVLVKISQKGLDEAYMAFLNCNL